MSMTRPLPFLLLAFALVQFPSRRVLAQEATPDTTHHQQKGKKKHTHKTFFTRNDAIASGVALGVTAGLSAFDVRIARWWQSPGVQGSQSFNDWMGSLTKWNETPLTIGSVLTYGIGRLTKSETVTDIGLHLTEAIVFTDVIAEAIRGPLGRARPRVSPDDQYNFKFWAGFTEFDHRAWPSIHAAAAFSIASALVAEIDERNPDANWYAAPLLYGAAMIPGITRMYLNQHWASDVAAGAFLGTLIGSRVVYYGHSHRPNKIERALGLVAVMPAGDGRWVVAVVRR
jgi:membrane-associated phospholipid phosphatase